MMFARLMIFGLLLVAAGTAAFAQLPAIPGTLPLTGNDDMAKGMVEGIHAYLDRELAASASRRPSEWHRDLTDAARYGASVAPNRERLRQMIGLTDKRGTVRMRLEAGVQDPGSRPGLAATGPGYQVYRVRWNVFRGVQGEGLLLTPDRP